MGVVDSRANGIKNEKSSVSNKKEWCGSFLFMYLYVSL